MRPDTQPVLLECLQDGQRNGNLVVLTGVQSANPNWLLLFYLWGLLGPASQAPAPPATRVSAFSSPDSCDLDSKAAIQVVFVSFLRDFDFWKTEARRSQGLDLVKLGQAGHLTFLDGLNPIDHRKTAYAGSLPAENSSTSRQRSTIYRRPLQKQASSQLETINSDSLGTIPKGQISCLNDLTISGLVASIESSLSPLKQSVLIIDCPNFLLSQPGIDAVALLNTVVSLRQRVHSTIMSLPADAPLLAASPASAYNPFNDFGANNDSQQTTSLDFDNAAFTIGICHQASLIMSCRLLDTGAAHDISGVLRATAGGSVLGNVYGVEHRQEWMYHVSGDGTTRVWERDAGQQD